MKRLAILFAVAVVTPSLVLAWLALRSLDHQQFIVERQQSLLCQGVADALARDAGALIEERQREFTAQVESLLAGITPDSLATSFDDRLRNAWPAAKVGFVVSLSGQIFSPSPAARPEARQFRLENDQFLLNRTSAEVYWAAGGGKGGYNSPTIGNSSAPLSGQSLLNSSASIANQNRAPAQSQARFTEGNAATAGVVLSNNAGNVQFKQRNVVPQSQLADNNATILQGQQIPANSQAFNLNPPAGVADTRGQSRASPNPAVQQLAIPQGGSGQGGNQFDNMQNYSKVASTEAEFRQLVGDATEGTVARFLQNQLNLMLWYRPPRAPQLVFGALLDLPALRAELKNLVRVEPALEPDLAVALLDENARPVAVTPDTFTAPWKRPFVATEIGEALPHWEMAVYLRDPGKLGQVTRTTRLTLGLLVAVLLVAIGTGSWLIVADVRRQLALARLKTDFVSNVSHELKTPLTSIRMFAELLAEGRAAPEKQQGYLSIITTEAARLTRLINNVLDFAKLDRGEKRYDCKPCDLAVLAGETLAGYRAHLESAGFTLDFTPPPGPVPVLADRDALAQVVVNLLSNAEKYSNGSRTVTVTLATRNGPASVAELSVLDRGPGVPGGCEEKIFEQFFRANDSLANGIQGSGLGLTLARQIARAHGGDLTYAPREGGGSCFTLTLPLADNAAISKS